MNKLSLFIEPQKTNSFQVYYPYYGLFREADVTPLKEKDETIFLCRLAKGEILQVKQMKQPRKWVDANLNVETPLSQIIGSCIEDVFHG
jgi:hypothetical protein